MLILLPPALEPETLFSRLRKDLRRTKALLRDAQAAVERTKTESSSKVVLRQLRNQVRNGTPSSIAIFLDGVTSLGSKITPITWKKYFGLVQYPTCDHPGLVAPSSADGAPFKTRPM